LLFSVAKGSSYAVAALWFPDKTVTLVLTILPKKIEDVREARASDVPLPYGAIRDQRLLPSKERARLTWSLCQHSSAGWSSMNRILVIGGTGNVGRQVVSQLAATGARFRKSLEEASRPTQTR
jgi:hypothetical protein